MKILGIDPGIARTGWGIIEIQNSPLRASFAEVATKAEQGFAGQAEFKVQSYGCVETSSKLAVPERLLQIYSSFSKLIDQYKPSTLVIEELFFNTNAKTALIVGQARGVVILAAAEKKISIITYTPLQVKVAITGYGRAEKSQIGKMIKTLLKLPEIPKPDDTSDALAVALTHAFSMRINSY